MTCYFVKEFKAGDLDSIKHYSNIDDLLGYLGTLDKDTLSISIYKAECVLDWS